MSEQDSIFRIQGPRGIADIIICKPDVSKNASIAYQEFREQVRVQAGTKDEWTAKLHNPSTNREFLVSDFQASCRAPGPTNLIWEEFDEQGIFLVSAGWQTKSYEFDRTPSGKVEAEGMNYTCLTAINEIVDNSIQWTKPNDGARVISVDLSKETLRVHNNGLGMNEADAKIWARLAIPQFQEPDATVIKKKSKDILFGEKAINDSTFRLNAGLRSDQTQRHINSILSQFGVGSNLSLGDLGSGTVKLRTKKAGSRYCDIIQYKSGIFRGEHSTEVWAGDVAEQFVEVQTTDIKTRYFPAHFSGKNKVETFYNTFKKDLAHVYFYYLTGPSVRTSSFPRCRGRQIFDNCISTLMSDKTKTRPSPAQVQVDSNAAFKPITIRFNGEDIDPKNCLEYEYLSRAVAAFPFRFRFAARPWTSEEQQFIEHEVTGAVLYYPTVRGKETLPTPDETTHSADKQARLVEIFWNGKLFVDNSLVSFDFMKKDKKRSHHFMAIPDACFEKRVHCVAFFSRQFRPSKNKTALTGSDALAEFQKIVNDDKLHIEYLRWLADCHRDYDDEIQFGGDSFERIDNQARTRTRYWTQCTIQQKTFSSNDAVEVKRINGSKPFRGRVAQSGFEQVWKDNTAADKFKPKIRLSIESALGAEERSFELNEHTVASMPDNELIIWEEQQRKKRPAKLLPPSGLRTNITASESLTLLFKFGAREGGSRSEITAKDVYERVGPLRAVIKQGQRTHSTSDIPFHGLDGYQWEVPALGAAGTYSLTVTLKDDEFQLNIPPWSENIVVKSGQPASLSFYQSPSLLTAYLGETVKCIGTKLIVKDVQGNCVSFSQFDTSNSDIMLNFDPPLNGIAATFVLELENSGSILSINSMTLHGILSKTHYEHQEVKTKISVRFKGVQSHLETPTSFDMKIFPGHPDTFELSSAAIAMLNAPMQNHSNLNMQFVVRDKFGNVTKGPGLSLEVMGSCVKSPGTGTEADLSKYSLNGVQLASALFQSKKEHFLKPMPPHLYSSFRHNGRLYHEFVEVKGVRYYMGDALLMPNNYKGILESISSETETGPKTLMIRFFYSGKDEEVKNHFAASLQTLIQPQSPRDDELLIGGWVSQQYREHQLRNRIVINSKANHNGILQRMGVHACANMFFVDRAFEKATPTTKSIVSVVGIDSLRKHKPSTVPFSVRVMYWDYDGTFKISVKQGDKVKDVIDRILIKRNVVDESIRLRLNLTFSLNGALMNPSHTIAQAKLNENSLILVQPARCNLDERTDTLRLALTEVVSGAATKRVICYQDFRLVLEPSQAPCRIRASVLRTKNTQKAPESHADTSGVHISISAGDSVELLMQVLDEIDNVCDVDGDIQIGDERFSVTSGTADVTVLVPHDTVRGLSRKAIFVPNSLDDTVELNLHFSIMIGPPFRILPVESTYTATSGGECSIQVMIADENGNTNYRDECEYKVELFVTPKSPENCSSWKPFGQHRRPNDPPGVFTLVASELYGKAGEHAVEVFGMSRRVSNSSEPKMDIKHSGMVKIFVSPGPAQSIICINKELPIELTTREFLPQIDIAVVDLPDEVLRNNDRPQFREMYNIIGNLQSLKLYTPLHLRPPLDDKLVLIDGIGTIQPNTYKTIKSEPSGYIELSTNSTRHRDKLKLQLQVLVKPGTYPFSMNVTPSVIGPVFAGSTLPKFDIELLSEQGNRVSLPVGEFVGADILEQSHAAVLCSATSVKSETGIVSVSFPDEALADRFKQPGSFKALFAYGDLSCSIDFEVIAGQPCKFRITDFPKTILADIVSPFNIKLEILDQFDNPTDWTGPIDVRCSDARFNCLPARIEAIGGKVKQLIRLRKPASLMIQTEDHDVTFEFQAHQFETLRVPATVHVSRVEDQSVARRQQQIQEANEVVTTTQTYLRSREVAIAQYKEDMRRSESQVANALARFTEIDSSLAGRQLIEGAVAPQEFALQKIHTLAPTDTQRGILGPLGSLFYADLRRQDELGGSLCGAHPMLRLSKALSILLGGKMNSIVIDPTGGNPRASFVSIKDELNKKLRGNSFELILVFDLNQYSQAQETQDDEALITSCNPLIQRSVVPSGDLLGYAVNLVSLSPTAYQHRLRRRLLLNLLRDTLVFRTEEAMTNYWKDNQRLKCKMICLDTLNQFIPGSYRSQGGEYRGPELPIRALHHRPWYVQLKAKRDQILKEKQQAETTLAQDCAALERGENDRQQAARAVAEALERAQSLNASGGGGIDGALETGLGSAKRRKTTTPIL